MLSNIPGTGSLPLHRLLASYLACSLSRKPYYPTAANNPNRLYSIILFVAWMILLEMIYPFKSLTWLKYLTLHQHITWGILRSCLCRSSPEPFRVSADVWWSWNARINLSSLYAFSKYHDGEFYPQFCEVQGGMQETQHLRKKEGSICISTQGY